MATELLFNGFTQQKEITLFSPGHARAVPFSGAGSTQQEEIALFSLGAALVGQMITGSIYLTESLLGTILPNKVSEDLFVLPRRDAKRTAAYTAQQLLRVPPPPAVLPAPRAIAPAEPVPELSGITSGAPGWGPMP